MSQPAKRSSVRLPSWVMLVTMLAGPIPSSVAYAQGGVTDPDPRGVYFHSWTGSSAGTGWLLCFARRGQRYRCSDTLGNGFDFSLSEDGRWLIDSSAACQGGPGTFENGLLRLDWRCGDKRFSSMGARASFTGSDFPVLIRRTEQGDDTLSGTWNSISMEVSPTTGGVLTRLEEEVEVEVSGKTFRMTFPDGEYFQGTFISDDRVAFRLREPTPEDPRFQTLQGSAMDRELDMLGLAEVRDPSHIEVVILTQSRAPVSDQIQRQYRYVLDR